MISKFYWYLNNVFKEKGYLTSRRHGATIEKIMKENQLSEGRLISKLEELIEENKYNKSYAEALCLYKEFIDAEIESVTKNSKGRRFPILSFVNVQGKQVLVDKSGSIFTDAIEYTDKYKEIEVELYKEILKEVGTGGYLGYCFMYWWTKKDILKEKYNIEWHSPGELNPRVYFD